jgi:hypothetical protein
MLKVHRKGYHKKAYTKKSGTKVSSARVPSATFCIVDVGAKGRGKKVVLIKRKGALKKLGYTTSASQWVRHKALNKAMRKFGKPSVFKMLQAQVVMRKRTQPMTEEIFRTDRDWVASQMTKTERMRMTQPARKGWMGMSHQARVLARK